MSERTAIRLCPTWTLLPGLTLRPVTTPSISLTIVAVAEVQFGLIQVAAGLEELGLGLLDGGRLGNEPGIDAIEVSLGVLLVKGGDGLFGRRRPRGREVTELRRALEQVSQRLPDGWRSSGPSRAALRVRSWPLGGSAGRPRLTRIA